MEAMSGAGRTSSMDSAMSARSMNSAQETSSPADVEKLIKAAGSPEAVIQYLLKEKHSQSQQNAQLWRLVDKQRAMILGLNKDLERALKDKEKYRKKLKEVMGTQQVPPLPAISTEKSSHGVPAKSVPRIDVDRPKEQTLEIPLSPGLDSDSQRQSPIDVSLAPYPITPPADLIPIMSGPPSAVGELLDPSHAMPKASEHALDQYDHEAQDRAADAARKEADAARDIPLNLGLPPSRSLPSEPPRMPPPAPPTTQPEEVIQFLPPSAPPPRKPPPAPLQLRETKLSPTIPPDEDFDTDSDYDDILEVDEIPLEKRGRRKTREEDDREREILARKEAEIRSLSKKSKQSNGSAKGTPKQSSPEIMTTETAASPRAVPPPMPFRENLTASLAGMLSGDQNELRVTELQAPMLSPGLPASPRPMNLRSPVSSPPLSPRMGGMPGGPLSPRPPRQPIPLPPTTPLYTPPETLDLKSPKPLNIIKKATENATAPSPTESSRDSPISGRTHVFKGLVTEEYPNLLLPPNALPSIDIRVASSRMKPSRASLVSLTQLEEDPVFTLAIFSRADGGELWRVEKDSASLAKLDQRLKQCAAFTARTPDRSLFSGHAPAKLDARRVALDQYLDELLNTALDLPTALELCKYLSTNTLPPNADETGSSGNSINEVAPKAGPGGRPFKHGYLTKRGKNFGGWKARFFVLDGPQLKYYETPGGAHLGTIKLQNAQIGKQSHHTDSNSSPARGQPGNEEIDNQYRHAFLILEPKKKDPSAVTKHVLCAESDKERDQWVDTLLRWIDYRDPDDEDPKDSKVHDRPGSGNDRVSGVNAKKKMYGQGKGPQHQPRDSDDALIGVSYEATKQGDAPQGAPSRPKTSGGFDDIPPTMSSQSGYTISAPRDPQVISDSSSWGSKMGMPGMGAMGGLAPPPGPDEKKARKRSFFGFGPKTRSSSDGTDSLFGDGNGAASSGNVVYSGPVRQVFGAPLAEAVRFNSPVDVRVPLPAVVYRCIQYLDAKNAVNEEGIFRLSGSNVVIKQLRERFNNESDINLLTDEQYHDIHAVASLLKLYLRELPTTILTRDLHLHFLSVTELSDQGEKVAALHELVQRLPQANGTLLKYLIAFLIKIINNANVNKMTVRNVGIVFSPTLNIPAPVFAMFLQNYEGIFGIEPEEYELPSPVSLDESRPSIDMPPQPRPATSGARESPHRQRLMEAIQDGQRTTPTPPPAAMNPLQGYTQQLRATPTPPPQRQLSYEPQYLAQQNAAGSHVSLRPAYESGFVVPQGYDPTQLQTPTQRVTNPGYDQPIYDRGGAMPTGYDQSYGMRNNRRESAIFGMGLTPQGSRSRLRDEAQF